MTPYDRIQRAAEEALAEYKRIAASLKRELELVKRSAGEMQAQCDAAIEDKPHAVGTDWIESAAGNAHDLMTKMAQQSQHYRDLLGMARAIALGNDA